jgi:arylsulfatase A-like enzyme
VIVTLDTVRADRMSCYGYARETTPTLDALAADALRFTRCLTPVTQTTPSHVTIFTGVTPYEHGVMSNHALQTDTGLKTSETLRTLAEALQAQGLRTGGFVGATPVTRASGLAAGFDRFTEPADRRRLGGEVIADALAFIAECGEAPFFAWLHLYDAHEPLVPPWTPEEHRERFPEDDAASRWREARGIAGASIRRKEKSYPLVDMHREYDGALRFMDDQLRVLFERLLAPPLRDRTVLVVVADHGTALGQHDHMGHGLVWDEQLRIPLLVRVPGVAPRTVDVPLSTLDLWPTVMALAPGVADAGFLAQCRGRDALADGFEPEPIFAFAANRRSKGTGPAESLTHGRWKLIFARPGRKVLYDLETDPHERRDVAKEHPETTERMVKLLVARAAEEQRRRTLHATGPDGREKVDPRLKADLEALGYVDGEEEEVGEAGEREDGEHGGDLNRDGR